MSRERRQTVMITHRPGYVFRVLYVYFVFCAPHVFEKLVNEANSFVPHKLVVALSDQDSIQAQNRRRV